jgi:hypothetical protein
MLAAGNYFPRTGNEVFGGYLNWVFGVNPTAQDLAKAASAVVDADVHIREFLSSERHQLRRSRITVRDEFHGATTGFNPSATSIDSQSISLDGKEWGLLTMWAPPRGRDALGLRGSPWTVYGSVHATAVLKQFATWEYFIPRPTGFPGRLDSYRRKAEQVLGSGLSASTVYDLTPWTWLANWFFDVGGLLRYQETVATNSVVASRSGWVYETRVSCDAYMTPSTVPIQERSLGGYPLLNAVSRKQTRRAGGPYGIVQPWSLSSNQAAIVAALAVTRYNPS